MSHTVYILDSVIDGKRTVIGVGNDTSAAQNLLAKAPLSYRECTSFVELPSDDTTACFGVKKTPAKYSLYSRTVGTRRGWTGQYNETVDRLVAEYNIVEMAVDGVVVLQKSDHEDVTERLAGRQKSIDELTCLVETLQTASDTNRTAYEVAIGLYEKTRARLALFEAEKATLSTRVETLGSIVDARDIERAQFERRLASSNEALRAAEFRVTSVVSEHANDVDNYTRQINRMTSEIRGYHDEYEAMRRDIRLVTEHRDHFETELREVKINRECGQLDIQHLRHSIDEVQKSYELSTSAHCEVVDQLNTEANTLQIRLKDANRNIEALERALNAAEAKILRLEAPPKSTPLVTKKYDANPRCDYDQVIIELKHSLATRLARGGHKKVAKDGVRMYRYNPQDERY